MKKLVLLLALALGGCATGLPSTEDISARAKQIQSYTKLACSFVPTVATIAAIVSKGGSAGITEIASDICTAVTTAPLADGPGDRIPRVKGVVVKGKFVR